MSWWMENWSVSSEIEDGASRMWAGPLEDGEKWEARKEGRKRKRITEAWRSWVIFMNYERYLSTYSLICQTLFSILLYQDCTYWTKLSNNDVAGLQYQQQHDYHSFILHLHACHYNKLFFLSSRYPHSLIFLSVCDHHDDSLVVSSSYQRFSLQTIT